MTAQEQKQFDQLLQLDKDLRDENTKFREDVKAQVSTLRTQVEQKFLPMNLEEKILSTVQISMNEAIGKALTGYDSPLIKLVAAVIEENKVELRGIISTAFNQVIRTEDFKASIVSAFAHKVARTIISNNDGLFDKVSNDMKQDATFKAKMHIAVANVIEECLKERK
jgi:division protein CdvB (Snf7/Vps24/ESCRT-III family)